MRNVGAGLICAALVLTAGGASSAAAQEPSFSYLIPDTGSTIGVNIEDVDVEEAARAKLRQPEGAIVRSVQSGGAASKAGIRSGDVIVEFDGERVRSAKQLQRLVQETPAARSVKATVMREGVRQTLDVSPEERSGQDPRSDARGPFTLPIPRMTPVQPGVLRDATPGAQGRLGATIRGLDGQLATFFGVKGGALVESVSPDSAAAAGGLKAGDVITAIDGRSVTTPEQVTTAIRDAQPGASVSLTVTRDRKALEVKVALPAAETPEKSSDRIRL